MSYDEFKLLIDKDDLEGASIYASINFYEMSKIIPSDDLYGILLTSYLNNDSSVLIESKFQWKYLINLPLRGPITKEDLESERMKDLKDAYVYFNKIIFT